jgi:two-component system CheB/CheR fusion protein
LQNLIVATDIGTLFLDTELCIQRFTPPVKDLFNIQKEDTDRSISAFTHRLEYTELEADARTVLEDQTTLEREVKSETDRWFLIRIRPYRTIDDSVEGVVFTFIDITHRKRSELKLKAATDRLRQRTEQVHALNAALTVAEERERQRLSQVLHDDLQQLLVAAQIRVNQLQSANENEDASSEDANETLQKVADELQSAIQTTRHLSSELMPPIGDDSLCDALQWLALHMKNSYDLAVELEAETSCPPLESSVHTLLFRTTRELLFNVVKHADVDKARVTVTVDDDDSVFITVSDEGAGFDPSELTEETGGGQGLFSIRERLEMIGGWYDVEAEPGAGTRTTIGVPSDAGTTPAEELTENALPESAE